MKKHKDNKEELNIWECYSKINTFLNKYGMLMSFVLSAFLVLISIINPALANNDYKGQVQNIVTSMVDIIGFIFKAVGVILGVYSVGQLILAFKNEDADSKSRASTQLVVSIALISAPAIINQLALTNKLK